MGDRDGDGSVNGQRSASDLGVVSTSVQNAEGEEDEVVGWWCVPSGGVNGSSVVNNLEVNTCNNVNRSGAVA